MSDKPGRFDAPSPKLDIGSIAGRKNGLVKVELPLGGKKKNQAAYVLVPIESVIEGLVEFAEADSLEFVLDKAFSNGDAARLEIRRVVPKPKCPKCGTECE